MICADEKRACPDIVGLGEIGVWVSAFCWGLCINDEIINPLGHQQRPNVAKLMMALDLGGAWSDLARKD